MSRDYMKSHESKIEYLQNKKGRVRHVKMLPWLLVLFMAITLIMVLAKSSNVGPGTFLKCSMVALTVAIIVGIVWKYFRHIFWEDVFHREAEIVFGIYRDDSLTEDAKAALFYRIIGLGNEGKRRLEKLARHSTSPRPLKEDITPFLYGKTDIALLLIHLGKTVVDFHSLAKSENRADVEKLEDKWKAMGCPVSLSSVIVYLSVLYARLSFEESPMGRIDIDRMATDLGLGLIINGHALSPPLEPDTMPSDIAPLDSYCGKYDRP